jgi:2-oxoisovalerate dehydrogenase E1 component
VENIRTKLWKTFSLPIYKERQEVANIIEEIEASSPRQAELARLRRKLMEIKSFSAATTWKQFARRCCWCAAPSSRPAMQKLAQWRTNQIAISKERYGSHLYSQSSEAYRNVREVKPVYSAQSESLKGFEVLNRTFDAMLAREPRFVAFGEDVGQLGGVNQSMAGMQAKYGKLRVSDTGIREVTILGQAIGMALRGLRPLAEIQYLDYLPYALQIMSDDLATTQWRTRGGQKAPVIVRTRGHRLEGVWHGGSPMGAIVHLLRGMHVWCRATWSRRPVFTTRCCKLTSLR